MEDAVNSKRNRRYIVDVLAALFGISSWIVTDGIFSELPILVDKLPEGWTLPSYFNVVIQAGNITIVFYVVLYHYYPRYVNESSATFFILTIGLISCCLLTFIWNVTTVIGGKRHSVSFIVIVFFLSIVDNMSNVIFIPFMGFFKKKYLISYLVGDTMSGLLPGLATLVQEIGSTSKCENVTINDGASYEAVMINSPLLFSVKVYFGFLALMMGISFVAFVVLRLLPSIETERRFISSDKDKKKGVVVKNTKPLTNTIFVYLLLISGWTSFLSYGVLPSISSYYCLPYGNVAYRLAISLSAIVSPLICLASFRLATRKTSVLTAMTIVGSLLALYLFILAVFSPNPPFVGTIFGQALVVIVSIGCIETITYIKTSIATVCRTKGVRGLFWYGASMQIGSIVGGVLMFVTVNVYGVFKSDNPCQ